MKILGIVCSPRKEGNTEILVQEALNAAKDAGAEVELLRISELKITPCDACRTCSKNGKCWIQDDMQKVYEKLLEADGIIIGSPVYFWTMSAYAKLLIDRTLALRFPEMRLENKVGGAIVVARRRGCVATLSALNTFMLGQEMITAGLGVEAYAGDKGAVRKNEEDMKNARELGKRIVKLIKLRQ